jgi:ATP-binding cassette subfamily F protein 3
MLLSVSNVKKAFGPDQILLGVTFRLDPKERVAMVGRNGAGKSTLLKILTERDTPDSGSFNVNRGAKIGYLRQEQPVTFGRTVIEEAQAGAADRLAIQVRLRELEELIEADQATAENLDEYALVHEHFLDAEGYSAERDVRTVLTKMGFEEDEFDKPTDALSGGEKTRLAIARILLEEPDLLILDEPTNHLDLQATEWLENWITQYHGAVLLVSHDRTFLEATAQRVLELRDGQVKAYPGPFGKYLELKQADEERQAEVAKRQAIELAKMDEYVRRFMNSQRTAQARGRLKQMEKLEAVRVHAPKNDKQMAGGFGKAARSGEIVVETKKLGVGFTDLTLIKDLNWIVRIGERWGVIGENGAGKSTLIKTVVGALPALGGTAKLGSSVVAGYFTQDASDLDPEMSPLDVLCYEDGLTPPEARTLLGRFLLMGDDVYRPVRTLSGGEKNKLSLARLTNLNPNLLVLDEPTNHLDMASREALADVLKDYSGTLILISHDRWLLSQVTDNTLDVRRNEVIQYGGSYTEYRNRKQSSSSGPSQTNAVKEVEDNQPKLSPRELGKAIEKLTKEISQIEDKITTLENDMAVLELKLAAVGPNDDVLALSTQHGELQSTIAATMAEWESLHTQVAELEAQRP